MSRQIAPSDVSQLVTATRAPRPFRIGVEGHSFMAYTHTATKSGGGVQTTLNSRGIGFWIQSAMRERARFPFELNKAVGGTNTTQMLARAPVSAQAMLATPGGVDLVVFHGLCNDTYQDDPSTTALIGRLTNLFNIYAGLGIPMLISGDTPTSGSFAKTAAGLSCYFRARRWLLETAPRLWPGFIFVDYDPDLADPTSTDNVAARFQADRLHPNTLGFSLMGARIAAAIQAIAQPAIGIDMAYQDRPYDATLNKRGNLFTNSVLNGDNGSGVATSWAMGTPTGMTATTSKVTTATGVIQQQIALTGTPTSGSTAVPPTAQFRQDVSASKFQVGDIVRARCLRPVDICQLEARLRW